MATESVLHAGLAMCGATFRFSDQRMQARIQGLESQVQEARQSEVALTEKLGQSELELTDCQTLLARATSKLQTVESSCGECERKLRETCLRLASSEEAVNLLQDKVQRVVNPQSSMFEQ